MTNSTSFQLSSLFVTTSCAMVLIGVMSSLGERCLLYFIPMALIGCGFMIGRRCGIATLGSVLLPSLWFVYFATFPHVVQYVKNNNIPVSSASGIWRQYEWFILYPTYDVAWFWSVFNPWWELCESYPTSTFIAVIAIAILCNLAAAFVDWRRYCCNTRHNPSHAT